MDPPYENVAWFGGSYSPPTKMHVRVALEIGKSLLKLTSEGRQCCVCVVPVSGKYKKGSVRDECIPQDQRWALAEAFLEAIKHDQPAETKDRLHFKLLDYEFKSPTPVTTIDSLALLRSQPFCDAATNIYIAQGQDNIAAILGRQWSKSDELLANYRFFMFPRGTSPIKDVVIELIETLIKDNAKQKYPPQSVDQALDIIKRMEFVGEGFSDDTSSSKVRNIIQTTNDVNTLQDYLHSTVFKKLIELNAENPNIYREVSCEKTPAAGGTRRKRRTVKRKI